MTIDPQKVYLGDGYFDEDEALAQMLSDGYLFANARPYAMKVGEPAAGQTVVLFVICSDTFAWGCADAEELPFNQIEPLYQSILKHPVWGAAIWCCKRRGEQPQRPVRAKMQAAGVWDDSLEALSPNVYDVNCERLAREKAQQ